MKLLDILKEAFESKYPSSNFKLLSKKREKNPFGEGYDIIYTYLLNDETYTTPAGLKFRIETIGKLMLDPGEKVNFDEEYFYHIHTNVYYKGKLLGDPDGIPGGRDVPSRDVSRPINKAKKWLDKNGETFIQGKGYQYKST